MTWDPHINATSPAAPYLITGANGGIGYFAADQLLHAGADVIVAGRNPAKLDAAIAALSASAKIAGRRNPHAASTPVPSRVVEAGRRRHHRVGNPTRRAHPQRWPRQGPKTRTVTDEGHELLFATNILGTSRFVGSVLGELAEAAHIVWLGSSTAIKATTTSPTPNSTEPRPPGKPMKVYAPLQGRHDDGRRRGRPQVRRGRIIAGQRHRASRLRARRPRPQDPASTNLP